MKVKFNIIMLMALLVGGLFTACNSEGDKFDYNKRALFISGTENNPVVKFTVEDTPSSYTVTVQSTKVLDEDVTLTLAIDPSLVDTYNAENSTNYYAIPTSAVTLSNPTVTISAGSALSDAAVASLVSTEEFVEGRTYLIPITIQSMNGNEDIIPTAKTIYLRVSRIINFYAINANATASSNFIFDKPIPLTTFTYELKIYPTGLAKKGPQRFSALEEADESKALLLRFNEANTNNQLQASLCGSKTMMNTQFSNGQWYLLTFVYDGTNFICYVDGEVDTSASLSISGINFQRYEMGMSWGGYRYSQFFGHRFCEIRVWNRALSQSEIAGGLCSVSSDSDGLQAYWKFNEGEGYIFHDATGHGYDMDWSKSQRDINENGVMVGTPDAANYIQWVKDDINKCAQ